MDPLPYVLGAFRRRQRARPPPSACRPSPVCSQWSIAQVGKPRLSCMQKSQHTPLKCACMLLAHLACAGFSAARGLRQMLNLMVPEPGYSFVSCMQAPVRTKTSVRSLSVPPCLCKAAQKAALDVKGQPHSMRIDLRLHAARCHDCAAEMMHSRNDVTRTSFPLQLPWAPAWAPAQGPP